MHKISRIARAVPRVIGAFVRRHYAAWEQRTLERAHHEVLRRLDSRTLRELGIERRDHS
jgi:uncharacterized protein YjiS (DUF1127 family)